MNTQTLRLTKLLFCLFFSCAANLLYAQPNVTGTVTSSEGEPLSGVSVGVKGTTVGTITSENGSFTLNVLNLNSMLTFSEVGFVTQDVPLNGRRSVSVVLAAASKELDQVVLVGYGTQRRANVTGAVATLDLKDVRSQPVTQTSQALQGRLAGVTVTQNFGLPGNDAGTIRIRGLGTFGSKDPLVLIDGVAGSINDINPNDIESLSVLKDASSASIYGSRAANGVILVTTKRGKKGDALSLTYNGMVSSQQPTDLPEIVDGLTHMLLRNEEDLNAGRSTVTFNDIAIQKYKDSVGFEPYFNTDWYAAAMKKRAIMHSHNLTFRGGSEKITSLISLSYLNQDALVENTGFKRLSLRFNNNFQASRRLNFALDGFLRREETDNPQEGIESIFRMMYEIPPIYPAVWSDGMLGEGWNGNNPLGAITSGARSKTVGNRLQLNLKANYSVFNWLKVEIAYAPKYLSSNNATNLIQYTYKRLDGVTIDKAPRGLNRLSNSNSRTVENFYQGLLRYNKNFGRHSTAAIVGYENLDYRSDNFSASRQNFPLPDYQVLSAGDENFKDNNGGASEWALASYFGRVNYLFDNKYLFEASLRRDGSSRFRRDHRWGYFPSFSLGWRVSEENFFKNIKLVNNLKFRASWGQLGNQEIGDYPYMGLVSLRQPYYFGGTVAFGAAQTVLPNTIVTWETATMLNAGIEFTMLRNRLSGSLDVYNKKTENILYNRDIPAIIGLSPSEQNIASMRNIGWDLVLGWSEKLRKVDYGVDFVLSDVKNRVISLNGKPIYGRNVTLENEEYQAFYGYEAIGIYRTAEDLAKYPTSNSNVKVGDLIFKDQNGDGKIDGTNDRVIIGSSIPRLTYGATFKLGYNNFDFSVFLQGVVKKDLYYMNQDIQYGGTYETYQLDRVNPTDQKSVETGTWPRLGGNSANNETNSFYLFNAAYLRCKNAVLSYNVPASLLKRVNSNSVRVYVSATNLFTIDKLPINTLDPEAPSGTSGANFYPNIKSYTLGLDVRF